MRRFAYRAVGRLPSPLKRAIVGAREARFHVGVIAVVLDERNEVLLFRHTYRPFAPWGLPSGWLRPDESLEESMVREIREEASLTVRFDRILKVQSAPGRRRVDVWMRYRPITKDARPSAEVDEARFFPLDHLPPLISAQETFLAELAAAPEDG
jgi:8-oxo-dGTP diphosphatase